MSESTKSVRSPSYPAMSLYDAIAATRKIEADYRRGPVDRESAAKIVGYSSLSGPATKALSALAQYGLVERAGKGELRVSERAIQILHPDTPVERAHALRRAAFEPTLFQSIQERWPDTTPPEDGIANFLRRQGFGENAIRPATSAYLQTLSMLDEVSDVESPDQASTSPSNEEETASGRQDDVSKHGGAKVGDLVQWESQGILRLEQPKKVRMISDDGQWIAVDGSQTGIPIHEVIVVQKAPQAEPPVFPMESSNEWRSQREMEIEWMRSRVGPNTEVRIVTNKELGAKEIGRLIKLLDAQRSVLEDED